MANIGDRIKISRERAGLKQVELAEKVGITRHLLYKYESGIVTSIPYDNLMAIASAVEVQPAYLMGWTDEPIEDDFVAKYHRLDQEDRDTVESLVDTLLSKSKYKKIIGNEETGS